MNEQETAKNYASMVTLELSPKKVKVLYGKSIARWASQLYLPLASSFAAPLTLARFMEPPIQLNMCQWLIVYKYREGKVKSNATRGEIEP